MKPFLCSLFLLFQLPAHPQRVHADLYAGVANYQGDLQDKTFTFNDAGASFGLGMSYDISNHFIIRGVANFLKVTGRDKPGVPAYDVFARNVNFQSDIREIQLALEYNIFDIQERGYTPYVFLGIAAYHFDPYTYDSTGKKEFLRTYGTEGQGLPQYPEKDLYENDQISIPFGGGVKFLLADNLQLGVEIGFRKLFTDYLDDVSGTYADSSILAAARGPQAAALAHRGSEIKGEYVPYPQDGAARGNPGSLDSYYVACLRLNYRFGGGGNGSGNRSSSRKSKTGCPVNVY